MKISTPSLLDNNVISTVFVGIWITFITSVMAYFLDFDRLYIYALIFGGAFTAVLLTGWEIIFLIGGLLILVPGIIILSRFLQQNQPLTEE
jgi:hypothetical protein